MIGLSLEAVKQSILDSQAVVNAAEAASLRAVARFGAFTRRRAQTSMRARKGVSEPGKPPSVHQGDLRRFILFQVESGPNVVIGPMLMNAKRSKTTLEALEHGGPSVIFTRGYKRGARARPPMEKPIMVKARPFMQPAFDEEIKRAPFLWEESLRAA